jgi:ABC-type antimicrobial peptide transport system permease subunit
MSFIKRRPFATFLLITLVGLVVGTLLGFAYAAHETRLIGEAVRAENPNDPLDMLPFIGFGFTLLGAAAGTVVGLVAAIVVALSNRLKTEVS